MTPKNKQLEKALLNFAKKSGALVMTEASSNLYHPEYIGCIDRLLVTMSEKEEQEFVPDILITIGHSIVSKKIKKHFRCMLPTEHWHVDPAEEYIDTFQSLTLSVPLKPELFFNQLAEQELEISGDYKSFWLERNKSNRVNGNEFVEKSTFSDLKAFKHILNRLPAESLLQMGNSSVVRYVLLFDPSAEITYNGNRGTSGIDGCTSTAVGASVASKKETTLITGDIAFFYDSNGLWNNYLKSNLKIILINNGGGGIFRIIPGPSTSEALEPYFETHHQMDAEKLAGQFELDYTSCENEQELIEGLDWLYSDRDKAGILEIKTPRLDNDQILKSYFKFLKDKIH
jgi:2-succinyl-5-enolpyruvyl-6-hydroxy-3-cyclohexene-1-carboxylate synthase